MSFAHICHLVFVCLSVEFFVTSHCYKSGAPPESCEDMLPSGHGADPQTSPAPFIISTDADCYNVSTPITVTVSVDSPNSDNVTYFEGLFVQARRPSDPANFTYGEFDALNDNQLQTIVCDNSPEPESENSIGHSIDKHFTVKTFTWTSPANFKENIQFVGTIVRKKIKYWINVRSEEIRVCGSKVESKSGGSNSAESKSTEDSNSNASSSNSLSLLLSAPSFLMWMMTHLVISL